MKVGCVMTTVEKGIIGKMTMQKAHPRSCLGEERSADIVERNAGFNRFASKVRQSDKRKGKRAVGFPDSSFGGVAQGLLSDAHRNRVRSDPYKLSVITRKRGW